MATREELRGNWDQVKERVQNRWQQVTDEELRQGSNDARQLVEVIQKKTGAAKQEIEKFIDQTIADAKPVFDRAAETVKEYAGQASEKMQQGYEQVATSVQAGYDQVATSVQAGYEQAEGTVRRHPLESVAVAFGAGIIAGVITGLVASSRRA